MEAKAEKQKVVIILGNGFDLDMHYVTKYGDFVKSAYFTPMLQLAQRRCSNSVASFYTLVVALSYLNAH